MAVMKSHVPEEVEDERLHQFAEYLEESDELTAEISTSVEIKVTTSLGDTCIKVKEYGNDGRELIPERDDEGNVTGYRAEGTSKVGGFVQDLADQFFGHHNYRCGFYEDEHTSETTIVPPSDG